jgi:CRP/FNR family transcriptional regulator, cyclic AMP receptor protein
LILKTRRGGRGKDRFLVPEGSNCCFQGEIADAVFYIQQGKVKLTVISEQGKEAVVAIVGPGHFSANDV